MIFTMKLLLLGLAAALHDAPKFDQLMGFRGSIPDEGRRQALVDTSGYIEESHLMKRHAQDPPNSSSSSSSSGASSGASSGGVSTSSDDCTGCSPRYCRDLAMSGGESASRKLTCVTECGPGEAPDPSSGVCGSCTDGVQSDPPRPYADHVAHRCVVKCPAGSAPNEESTCEVCTANSNGKDYADHAAHKCVANCPSGKAPDANNDCIMCPHAADGLAFFADHTTHTCVEQQGCPAGYAPDGSREGGGSIEGGDTAAFIQASKAPGDDDAADDAGMDGQSGGGRECKLCEAPELYTCDVDGDCSTVGCVDMCPDGYGADLQNKCVSCGGSTPYSNKELNKCVANCAYGYAPHGSAGVCTQCETASVDGTRKVADHTAGSQKCAVKCPDGQAADATNTCRACPPKWNPKLKYANHQKDKGEGCVKTCESAEPNQDACANTATMNCDIGSAGDDGTCDGITTGGILMPIEDSATSTTSATNTTNTSAIDDVDSATSTTSATNTTNTSAIDDVDAATSP